MLSPWVLSHGSCQLDLCHRYKSGGAPHPARVLHRSGAGTAVPLVVARRAAPRSRTVDAAPRASAAAFLGSTLLATIRIPLSCYTHTVTTESDTPGRGGGPGCPRPATRTIDRHLAAPLHTCTLVSLQELRRAACAREWGEIIFINFGSDTLKISALALLWQSAQAHPTVCPRHLIYGVMVSVLDVHFKCTQKPSTLKYWCHLRLRARRPWRGHTRLACSRGGGCPRRCGRRVA